MYSNNYRKSFLKNNKKYYEFIQRKFPINIIPPFSIIHTRDIFLSKFTLIQTLFKKPNKKYINQFFSNFFIAPEFSFYYLFNIKDLKLRQIKILIKNLLFSIFKLIFSLIDYCSLLVIASFFSIFFKRNKSYDFESIKTIYYNSKRKNNSHKYYYKDGLIPQKCLYVIVERDSYISTTSYYLDYQLGENHYFSPLHCSSFLNIIKAFLKSLKDLFLSLTLLRQSKFHVLTVLENIVNLNSSLFYYISYFSLKDFLSKYIKELSKKNIYNWYEGQRSNFILPTILREYKIDFTSFIGFSFSNSFYPHQVPSEYELKEKLLGNHILFQDSQSVEEFEILLRQYKFNKISYSYISEKLSRGAFKNIDFADNLEKSKSYKSILYLSHASLAHTYIGLSKLAFNLNKKKKEYSKFKYLYIRLHPALRNKFDLDFFDYIDLPPNITLKFRNENSITPQDLILFSDLVASADSNLLNFALFKNKKTLGVLTDFRFNPPINKKFQNSKNLTYI